jgi:hypothetical protein
VVAVAADTLKTNRQLRSSLATWLFACALSAWLKASSLAMHGTLLISSRKKQFFVLVYTVVSDWG